MRGEERPDRMFFMIKPDGVPREAKILEMIAPLVTVIASRHFDSTETEKIEGLYEMHKGKEFYPYLVDHFRGRPIRVYLLGKRDEVHYQGGFYDDFMALVGDTDPAKAQPGTIRSLSTDSIERSLAEGRAVRNLVHRSTTPEEAEREAAIFFWDYIHDRSKVEGAQRELGRFLAEKGDGIFYEERLESGLRKCNLLSLGEELLCYRDLDRKGGGPLTRGAAIIETLKDGSRSAREITVRLNSKTDI